MPGRTLWEWIRGASKPKTVENGPLPEINEILVGSSITFDTSDYHNITFVIKEIWLWKWLVNEREQTIIDYHLLADDKRIILRLTPVAQRTHNACVLSLFGSSGDKLNLEEAVNDPEGILVYGQASEEVFHRINTAKIGYECNVTVIRAGSVTENRSFKMWDYSRITKKSGRELTEFLYVQQDGWDKSFEIWRGNNIEPACVKYGATAIY